MLHRIASALILSAAFGLAGSALANQPQGDGKCPIDTYSDPDCARAQPYQPSKSSREEFPRCRNWRAGQPRPAGCRKAESKCNKAECRNQFPGGRPRQPIHLG